MNKQGGNIREKGNTRYVFKYGSRTELYSALCAHYLDEEAYCSTDDSRVYCYWGDHTVRTFIDLERTYCGAHFGTAGLYDVSVYTDVAATTPTTCGNCYRLCGGRGCAERDCLFCSILPGA